MKEQSPIESALALHASGALEHAENEYRRILATDPGHVEAQHYLGVLLHQQGHTQAGVSLILGALQPDSGSSSRYNDLGNILGSSGRYRHNRDYLSEMLALHDFAILRIGNIVLRNEICRPIQGIGVLAAKIAEF